MVGEGAIVDYYTDQRESERAFHVANIQAHVSAKGVFASHAFSTGAKIQRHDIGIALKGEGADCTMNGVYLADGERLLDTHTSLDHAMPHCTSHEIYKGILAGKAKAVFNGRIIVRLDAQKTDAKQTNRALLLSDDATINSNPQLEIFADDVKCTHGAAVGQLDEEAMFYLQARGLTRLEARDMLLHAFAGEVMEGLKIPALREQIETNFFTALARDVAVRLIPAGRAESRSGQAAGVTVSQAIGVRLASEGARARLSDPVGARARQAARLSGQRQHQPEAAVGDHGDRRLLPPRQREHPSRDASVERARDRAV